MRRSLVMLLALGALSGCAGNTGEAGAPGRTTTSATAGPRAAGEGASDLVGVTWVVTGFRDGDEPIDVESPGVAAPVLRFEANGFLTGNDGCNGFGYTTSEDRQPPIPQGLAYDVTDDRISFDGNAIQTLIACAEGEHHERFWAVLRDTATWEIHGETLVLVSVDGRGVTYVRETPEGAP